MVQANKARQRTQTGNNPTHRANQPCHNRLQPCCNYHTFLAGESTGTFDLGLLEVLIFTYDSIPPVKADAITSHQVLSSRCKIAIGNSCNIWAKAANDDVKMHIRDEDR